MTYRTIRIPVRCDGVEAEATADGFLFDFNVNDSRFGPVRLFAQLDPNDGAVCALTHFASGRRLAIISGSVAKTERGAVSVASRYAADLCRRLGAHSFVTRLAALQAAELRNI